MVRHKDAQVIRDVLMADPMRLVNMALRNIQVSILIINELSIKYQVIQKLEI